MYAAPGLKRILLVLQSADPPTAPGGMETHCVDLAAEYVRRGLDVAAVVPETYTFDALEERFRAVGASVARLNTDARRGRALQWDRCRQLVQQNRRWRPDVVHLHTGGATGGLAAVAAMRCATGAAIVVTEHDVPGDQPRGFQRAARHAMDRLTHAVVAVSRRNAGLRSERLGARPEKFAAVLNGVPVVQTSPEDRSANRSRVRADLGIDRNVVLVGSLVRLAEGKGLDDLLRAFAITRRQKQCKLMLVGDGPLREQLQELARELEVGEDVLFAGHHTHPAPLLDAMDLFVLPVPAGSMSIALLEAMAAGLPPVITFCGPEEAVIHEETGLCAPPSDPDGLAAAILRLVGEAGLRSRLGAAAARHVRQNLSVQRVADDLLDVYATARAGALPSRLLAGARPIDGSAGRSWCESPNAAMIRSTP